jgi:anti-anti-sigma factor
MNVRTSKGDDGPLYFLSGTLKYSDGPVFTPITKDCGAPGHRVITLDLSELKHIDSIGLGLILVAHDEAERAQNRLVLRHACPNVRRVFEMTALTELLTED